MIDFRYHIVSLISVFLALAVGIILGAGPLKESIGDQLTGQVDALRADKDTLRSELDAAGTALTDAESFVAATAPSLLEGVLPDRRVAVIQTGTIDDAVYDSVEQQILASGATVSARVQVTDAWTDPDQASTRQSYATSLADYLDAPPTEGFDTTLAQVLVDSLTDADPANPDAFSADAVLTRAILVDGELVEVLTEPQAPADAFVVLTPTVEGASDNRTPAQDDDLAAASAIEIKLVTAAQDGSEGVVVAGTVPVKDDLVSVIRSDADLAASLTTVTGIERITGAVNVPLSLAARINGQVGQFGFGEGATAPAPPAVALQPVVRTPAGDATGEGEAPGEGDDLPAEGDAG